MSDREADDLSAERLAEEIRRAIPPPAGDSDLNSTRITRAWENIDRYIVPSVEPGVSFFRIKKILLRLMRLVTRSQGTFNVKLLDGVRELEKAILERRRFSEDEVSRLRREIDLLHARFSAERTAGPESGATQNTPVSPAAALPEGFYVRFEEEFRGGESAVRERQAAYADFFRPASGPVLDCGCGRGEFLEILGSKGIRAEGVDSNSVSVALAKGRGLDAAAGDAFAYLRGATGALGGIAALQFIEHLEPAAVFEFLRLAHDALAPGGLLLVETLNPDSLYAMRAFRLDPTHRWPVPPRTLDLMAREAGFDRRELKFYAPVPPSEALEERDENDRKLNRWIFGPQDYTLFAERPR